MDVQPAADTVSSSVIELKAGFPKWLSSEHVKGWASSSFRKSQLSQVDVSHKNPSVAFFLKVGRLSAVNSSGSVSSSTSVVSASVEEEHALLDLSIRAGLWLVMDDGASWAGGRNSVKGLPSEVFLSTVELVELVDDVAFSNTSASVV